MLTIVIHVGWAMLVWYHDRLPIAIVVGVGAWLIAWHGSLQHETIHGHPTGNARINALLGSLPLSLWLPYRCYLRDHVAHHATEKITDPVDDPESRYLAAAPGVVAALRILAARVQATLIGRLVLGPGLTLLTFVAGEVARLRRQPVAVARDWIPHLAGGSLVLVWLHVSHMGLGFYLLGIVYPATSLVLLRSFAEHRAADDPDHRVAVVEQAGLLGLLFLNNNLHVVHHQMPGLPWYRIPAFYRVRRDAILERNGRLLYRGYGEIVRRYWRRPHDVLIHPQPAI